MQITNYFLQGRGRAPKAILFDEAWFTPEHTIDIWGPQVLMGSVALLIFSSPAQDKPWHWFGRIISNKNHYNNLKVINLVT